MTRRSTGDAGSAAVDFTLVAGFLLTPLFLGIVQLALGLHVRNTLVACANEGARLGAAADGSPAAGVARTRECISTSLRAPYADEVTADRVQHDGVSLIEVTVRAPLPIVAFAGPAHRLVVHAHAIDET